MKVLLKRLNDSQAKTIRIVLGVLPNMRYNLFLKFLEVDDNAD